MTTFEQELIRAIEHGCPECGDVEWIRVEYLQQCFDVAKPSYHGDELEWDFSHMGNKRKELKVTCRYWHTLWTAEDGWIPELKEVVESD